MIAPIAVRSKERSRSYTFLQEALTPEIWEMMRTEVFKQAPAHTVYPYEGKDPSYDLFEGEGFSISLITSNNKVIILFQATTKERFQQYTTAINAFLERIPNQRESPRQLHLPPKRLIALLDLLRELDKDLLNIGKKLMETTYEIEDIIEDA